MESGESGKLPLKFVGFAKLARPPSKLNSTAISENLPLKCSSKMTLGNHGHHTVNNHWENSVVYQGSNCDNQNSIFINTNNFYVKNCDDVWRVSGNFGGSNGT